MLRGENNNNNDNNTCIFVGTFLPFWLPLRVLLFSRTSFSQLARSGSTTSFAQNAAVGPPLMASLFHTMNQQSVSAPWMHLVSHVSCDWNQIWKGSLGKLDQATLVALKAPHSSGWLFTLRITSCGLRLSDEAIRVAVGLRLGLNIVSLTSVRVMQTLAPGYTWSFV